MTLKFKISLDKQAAQTLLADYLSTALIKVIRANLSIAIDKFEFEVEIKDE